MKNFLAEARTWLAAFVLLILSPCMVLLSLWQMADALFADRLLVALWFYFMACLNADVLRGLVDTWRTVKAEAKQADALGSDDINDGDDLIDRMGAYAMVAQGGAR